MTNEAKLTIAIIGGTGDLGSGLAKRWSAAGYPIVIGSRSGEKASDVARTIAAETGGSISGDVNVAAAQAGDIVVIAVPFSSHEATLTEIKGAVAGKIVVDAVVPLVPPKLSIVQMPEGGSAAGMAQRLLDGDARLVSAFHNVGAKKLHAGRTVDCDILVFGDDKAARDLVIELAGFIGTRGLDGGPLANSLAAEAMTSILIGINRRYKVDGAGLRITGLAVPPNP